MVPHVSQVEPSLFNLVAEATAATDCSELELASCGATVSVHMDFLHPAEISVTYLSTPRLMTTHDVVPSHLEESICTSMPYRS